MITRELKFLNTNQEKIPNHCACCGQKSDLPLMGPFETGPYKWVCQICHDLKFTWYPDKTNKIYPNKFGISRIGKWELSKLPNGKPLKILLVEPDYYTRFPPLGLLKLSTYHKKRGDIVELLRIKETKNYRPKRNPDIIYITSLFSWAWKSVYEAVYYYRKYHRDTKVILGGIYASILPDHAAYAGSHLVHTGLINEIENLPPDFNIISNWDGNILFGSRGCVRRCSFCVVPKLEGAINNPKSSILHLLNNNHSKIYFWDNNILAAPNFFQILEELQSTNYKIDFNQGLDARLVTKEIAEKLSKYNIPYLHLAYDTKASRNGVKKAIEYLKDAGFRGKKLIFYTLFNHKDTPGDFLERLKDLLKWGVVSYPMRFEPLTSLKKNQYVSPNWTKELLKKVVKARRVIGFGGSFPPYEGLIKKITSAKTLEEAMELEPIKSPYAALDAFFTGDDYY